MPKIDPIRTTISPDLGVGSAHEWGCSYDQTAEFITPCTNATGQQDSFNLVRFAGTKYTTSICIVQFMYPNKLIKALIAHGLTSATQLTSASTPGRNSSAFSKQFV
jgi:hypothetical protein